MQTRQRRSGPPLTSCDVNCNTQYTENRFIYEQPDALIRPLAFYDVVSHLIRPSGLLSDGVLERENESSIDFKLTVEQADMIAMSLGKVQVILRFCYLDTMTQQDDNFPPETSLFVNNTNVVLPPAIQNPNKPELMPKRPGQIVNITSYCKLCPFVSNSICIKWFVDTSAPSRSYVVTVIIGKRLESSVLLQRIIERGLIDPESTKRLISDSDNEVATTTLQCSLMCPLGKTRMQMPCKARTCQHIPCFDAYTYIQMNEKKSSWTCPICYKPAYFLDLMIDAFFLDILKNSDHTVTEVTLNLDGSWSPILKIEQPVSTNHSGPEIITISDDDD